MLTRRVLLSTAAALSLSGARLAMGQAYPEKPIKLIVPYPTGGSVDAMARLVAQSLSSRLGQTIIENRPGGGASIGARSVALATPDGYTLLFGSAGSLCVIATLYSNLGYDPLTAFTPVATVSVLPPVFVVGPSVPATSIAEFVAYAKANPGKLNYGSALGAPPHLSGALFKVKAGIDVVYIPYKGAAQSVTDLLGGQTHFTIDSLTSLYPLIKDGRVKALAVASTTRWPELPDVPTLIESGYPDFTLDAWTGVVAPAGTPPDIVNKLNAAINEGLRSPELQTSLINMSALPKIGSPEDFAAFLAAEMPKWAAIVKLSGAKIDGG